MNKNNYINEQRICIVCPAGCRLTISGTAQEELTVTGGKCKRGITYGQSEITDPRRTVTAVVPGCGINDCCIPVKTDKPLPRALINKLLAAIYSTRVELPVYSGDILLENFCGTQINVVATRTMNKAGYAGTKTVPGDFQAHRHNLPFGRSRILRRDVAKY